tara:strand:- start:6501 stop:7160 length:660 start_codon:yes stop_codon:yes gene_type:complete
MTTVIAPKEAVAPKIVGKAIYLELEIDPEVPEDIQKRASWQRAYNPTKQVILFPAWTDDYGKTHRSRFMEREVSSTTPRAQWDFSPPITPVSELVTDENAETYYSGRYFDYKVYTKDELVIMPESDIVEATFRNADLMLKKMMITTYYEWEKDPETGDRVGDATMKASQAWRIRSDKPLAVEVTDEDMKLLGNSKTPQAVIRRVAKLRSSIDSFPEKLS